MADIIDIMVPLRRDMPVCPGCTGIQVTPTMRLENGDSSNISHLDCNLHTGIHTDAPRHFLRNRSAAELLPLKLSSVQRGFCELVCLLLKLVGAEAAPAGATLRKMGQVTNEPSTKGVRP